MTNANNEVTRTVYNPEGNVLQLIDGKSQTNWFTYDSYARLLRQTNAAGTLVLTNGYDNACIKSAAAHAVWTTTGTIEPPLSAVLEVLGAPACGCLLYDFKGSSTFSVAE